MKKRSGPAAHQLLLLRTGPGRSRPPDLRGRASTSAASASASATRSSKARCATRGRRRPSSFQAGEVKAILGRVRDRAGRAKRVLSVAVYNHYKRSSIRPGATTSSWRRATSADRASGSGKTLLARNPLALPAGAVRHRRRDQLTEAGYVGEDVENVAAAPAAGLRLPTSPAPSGGIIYIDEIDKIGAQEREPVDHARRLGRGRPAGAAEDLEGTVANVPPQGAASTRSRSTSRSTPRHPLYLRGAFEGIQQIVEKRIGKKSIGFGAERRESKELNNSEIYAQVEPEDLLRYGLIRKLVGRLPITVSLTDLDQPALIEILTRPKNALIKQYQRFFEMEEVRLEFTEGALKAVSQSPCSATPGRADCARCSRTRCWTSCTTCRPGRARRRASSNEDVIMQGAAPIIHYRESKKQA